ncbi:MAG TPA: ATP-grasp domain-containing protein [Syntrophomonas sp.]|nr:ATP-grasp domain-containing protein [Syntrophomonas sp.]
MKLLCLGAGFNQLNAIRKAKSKGYTLVVSDYLPDAPGKRWADHAELVSTFDVEANIEVARKYGVDGVFAIGTDQPVYTAACVAQALGLAHMITPWTALRATNKKYMKECFAANHIPCSRHCFIHKDELQDWEHLRKKLSPLRFPAVVKPLDSQGQRGIFKLPALQAGMANYMRHTFAYTRSDEIIVEEFFAGDEITVSAWVDEGQAKTLMVTDRPLINIEPHLGTPDGHVYPSPYWTSHHTAITELVNKICRSFDIQNGPLYIQMMSNGGEFQVVEIACRIGGGHEEELIPLVTGIDVVDLFLDRSAGKAISLTNFDPVDPSAIRKNAMVKFIVARPGMVDHCGDLEKIKTLPGVVNAGFYHPEMERVEELVDSTKRIGYLLMEGKDPMDLQRKTRFAYQHLQVLNPQGENLVVDTWDAHSIYRVYR